MFEESLIESTRVSRRSGRGVSLPLSIALHVLVLGAAIGTSFWFGEEAPEPPVPMIFYSPGSLPAPLGTSPKANSVPPQTARRAAPTSQSVAVFNTAPFAAPGPEVQTAPDSDASVRGDGSGDSKGVPGSIGDSENQQVGPGRGVEATFHPGGDVRPPLLIERVEPEYPEIDRKIHKEGIVILEAIITSDGTVDEVKVLKSADAVLDEAAKRAVMQWRYRPATLNGRAVRVYLTVTVSFRLH
jgi:protein TonB